METWGDWAYLHDLVKAGGEALEAGEVPEPSFLMKSVPGPFPPKDYCYIVYCGVTETGLEGTHFVSCPCCIFDGIPTLSHASMGDSNKLIDSLS